MTSKGPPGSIAAFFRMSRRDQPLPALSFIGYMPQIPRKGEWIHLHGQWRRVVGVDWEFDEGPHAWEAILDLEDES